MKSARDGDYHLIEAIAEDFYMITLPMPFRLGHVHVFAVVNNSHVTLFDTGLNSAESRKSLGDALEFIGVPMQNIDAVYITHYHADHCGMAGWLQAEFSAAIHMSEIDNGFLEKNRAADVFVRLIRPFYRRHGLPDLTIELFRVLREQFKELSPPFLADDRIRSAENLTDGNRSFRAIPAPGHTRGQLCYYFPDEGILLSGDHVLPDITPNLSPDLFFPCFYGLSSYLNALQRLKSFEIAKVYPGHGAPFANYQGRIDEITTHHDERKALILASLEEGSKTTFQVAQAIFGTNLPEFDQFLALNETYVHIEQLLREGRVAEEEHQELILYSARMGQQAVAP
jgi:glyoxylase-like metal-dependent hydrolase (beta-lactamase superfamily II)